MFLSPKTIEHHERNVYRTLGIHSRPELSEAVARLHHGVAHHAGSIAEL
jgi:DNA-binding CsgD family transcriptional regulator